ncbi:hypothetical protein [Bacillus toyonensis]|uniref:hypothetical protein n=1 Tax=Bacillus toyonensis TaxID=155322 RepID=UPI002E1C26A9|nr:hypothetical protein [Bacillus toyonensis]
MKTSFIEFELEAEDMIEEDKQFIQEIIMMVDRKATTHSEDIAIEELKQKYSAAKEGYNALNPDIQGFHKGVDEYIAIAVDREYEDQKNADSDKEEDTIKELEKQYIGAVAEMAGTVENIEGGSTNSVYSEELNKGSEEVPNMLLESTEDEESQSNTGTTLLNGSTLTDDPSVRLSTNGKEIYQMYYKCPRCSNKGKRYIPKESIYTNCHSCHFRMRVQHATTLGFPNKDAFQNIFIAGAFKRL